MTAKGNSKFSHACALQQKKQKELICGVILPVVMSWKSFTVSGLLDTTGCFYGELFRLDL